MNKAVFLDRDNTIIDDPGYLDDPDGLVLLPGAAEAITGFQAAGYRIVIITNQSGIARGYFDHSTLERIHQRLRRMLAKHGAKVDAIYHCPYHPDGKVPEFTKESDLRKPAPGMILQAADDLDIDLASSWMIGDSLRDVQAGSAAGCHTVLIAEHPPRQSEMNEPGAMPDFVLSNLKEAVSVVTGKSEHPSKNQPIEEQQMHPGSKQNSDHPAIQRTLDDIHRRLNRLEEGPRNYEVLFAVVCEIAVLIALGAAIYCSVVRSPLVLHWGIAAIILQLMTLGYAAVLKIKKNQL